jgi:hypothetical protein
MLIGALTIRLALLAACAVVAPPEEPAMASPSLSWSPRALASDGAWVLVLDDRGHVLWWRWPDAPHGVVSAHTSAGPVASGATLLTTGGWDPTVHAWVGGGAAPAGTWRPFDGRVVGVCAEGGGFWVLGSDRSDAPTQKEELPLAPAALAHIDAGGVVTRHDVGLTGRGAAIACGPGWVAAVDREAPTALRTLVDGAVGVTTLPANPSTLAGRGAVVLAADASGLRAVDPRTHEVVTLAKWDAASPTVLALLPVGDVVLGATSAGVAVWPGGAMWRRGSSSPVALAPRGDGALVLWDDGVIEERDVTGVVRASHPTPRGP